MTEQIARAGRLVQIERLLRQTVRGKSVSELSRDLGCSIRTIQRDLLTLQSEPLHVPIEQNGRRYRVMPDAYPLAPVRLTLQEARAIYLSTRLLARYADERDPAAISALEKVADVLPPPVSEHVTWTVQQLRQRPENAAQDEVMKTITKAWATSKSVAIQYRSGNGSGVRAHAIDPYLLEPSTTGAATYVIGYSHKHEEVRVFKIDRIKKAALSGESFEPVDLSTIAEKLSRSWSGVVMGGDEQFEVTLDFSPTVTSRVRETNWHPTQRLTDLPEGGVRLELLLPSLLEFVPWVQSWGSEVVVIGPGELRKQVADSVRMLKEIYAADL
jgi:predicted DNA-binding transcriptional regulator YafY